MTIDTQIDVLDIIHHTALDRYDTSMLDMPNMPRFLDLVRDALAGRLDLSPMGLVNSFAGVVFAEFVASGWLIRQLVVIAIIGALMSVLTEAFSHKSAGETGFYVTFLMTAALAVSSYYVAVGILTQLVNVVTGIMYGAIPVMIGLLIMSGNFVGAAGFNSVLFFALQFFGWFVSNVFVPLILASAALDIASKLFADGAKLDMLANLVQKIANWALKGMLALFAFLVTLQRISAPIAGNIALRTSRNIVRAAPVVGNAFAAAMDTVVGFSQAAKSGVLVALVIILCVAIATPLVKIFSLSFIYNVVAAFLQPVADPRLVALMGSISNHLKMLFSAAGLVGVTCVYIVIIMLISI